MEEYRKMIDIGPVSLTDTDFQELERIVSRDLGADESVEPRYKAEHRTRIVEADTIAEFFAELEQGAVPSDINVSYWIRRQGDPLSRIGYVSIDLHRRAGFLGQTLHVSSSDQTWFLGKTELLAGFLRKRHLWYWRIASGLPWSLSILIGIELSLLSSFLKDRNVVPTLYSALSLLISVVVYVLATRSILFPGFVLSGPVSSKPSGLRTSTFWTAIGAIATVIATLVSIASFAVQLLRR